MTQSYVIVSRVVLQSRKRITSGEEYRLMDIHVFRNRTYIMLRTIYLEGVITKSGIVIS